ncbi:MAG: protein-L-isoaspartate O-methyltransferase [Planctomycetia bacterium 21-64-5]|nr:MAG: protein-L-isoaspartate O-methyltransferase [Planctomycetia bacterium 21-64-5]HQU41844.1 protein-L-isoaspartate(D-aspartate) O-methyltransferase [Pirellulales bacterium]
MEPSDFDILRQHMVRDQLRRRGIHDRRVLDAMLQVPREAFVLPELAEQAYVDRALPIDCGQTISQPYIVALMTEALDLAGPERVLEIGTGSGYQTAVLSRLAAQVVSLERHAELAASARAALDRLGCHNVELIVGDGSGGWPPSAPYNRILVAAATGECPIALIDQLAEDGRLVIPLGDGENQTLRQLTKRAGQQIWDDLVPCRFVPLVAETHD